MTYFVNLAATFVLSHLCPGQLHHFPENLHIHTKMYTKAMYMHMNYYLTATLYSQFGKALFVLSY